MTQIFQEDGTVAPVTVIQAGPCFVTQIRTRERDGYEAVQIGFGEVKKLNQPLLGHLKGLRPLRHLRELRISGLEGVTVGQQVDVSIFQPGDKVNISGISKGRGFAGVVKRHGFAGGPKTHGQSDRHRAAGSIGATTDPGRVFKGLRMAGHMGNRRVTIGNLDVLRSDPDRHLLLVKGSVPGPRKGLVIVKKAGA